MSGDGINEFEGRSREDLIVAIRLLRVNLKQTVATLAVLQDEFDLAIEQRDAAFADLKAKP